MMRIFIIQGHDPVIHLEVDEEQLCVLWSVSLSLQSVPRCKKSGIVCLEAEES